MKSLDYWKNREEAAKATYITEENEIINKLNRMYNSLLVDIQKEINGFYTKYATAAGMTYADAVKAVSKMDVEAFADKAKKYVKTRDFSARANAELKLYNATMKINRLELLKANIGLEMIDMFNDVEELFDNSLYDRAINEFSRQAGILGDSVKDATKSARSIVNASFQNAHFSDRIWMYQGMLKNELSSLLLNGLVQGQHANVLARDLQKRFGASKSDAERLMRTEMARVQIAAQEQSYRENGFDQYMFLSLGARACPICRKLNEKIFDVRDMMPGTNAPPMHPYCRCSTAAYMDRNQIVNHRGSKQLKMNLQFFAKSNKQSVLEKIKTGQINKEKFDKTYQYYKQKMGSGIKGPLGLIEDKKDAFYHIADHHPELISKSAVDRIISTMSSPASIYKAYDRFKNEAQCYIENSNSPLIVVTRNGIITSYEPSNNKLAKIKGGELLWKKS